VSKSLVEIQESFQRAILEGDDAFLECLVDSPREKKAVLLGVYRDAYRLRLIEILQHDYEKLLLYLGDDQFESMACAYIAANPSRCFNARRYGARTPEFLAAAEPYASRPELAEIASFERALFDVFDEEDVPALKLADVTVVAPEAWPDLVFQPHKAVRRLDLRTNAVAIWQALDEGGPAPAAVVGDEPERFIVYRPETTAMYRGISYEEAIMWNEAAKGAPFGALCEIVAIYGGEDGAAARAAGYLGSWLDGGLLVGT
jgi:hypothetical protein